MPTFCHYCNWKFSWAPAHIRAFKIPVMCGDCNMIYGTVPDEEKQRRRGPLSMYQIPGFKYPWDPGYKPPDVTLNEKKRLYAEQIKKAKIE